MRTPFPNRAHSLCPTGCDPFGSNYIMEAVWMLRQHTCPSQGYFIRDASDCPLVPLISFCHRCVSKLPVLALLSLGGPSGVTSLPCLSWWPLGLQPQPSLACFPGACSPASQVSLCWLSAAHVTLWHSDHSSPVFLELRFTS